MKFKDKLELKWEDARTLGHVVYDLIIHGKKDSKEFQELLKYFGENKLREEFTKHKERLKSEKGGS